jgi:tetratricopeptide (TPR) repeat protein
MFQIFQKNFISKEIRLWNNNSGLKFVNPIFETLYDDNTCFNKDIIIYSNNHKESNQLDIIKQWKKNYPLLFEPYYYEACILLQQLNYKEFISIANHYLFLNNKGISAIMMQYYLAMTYCYQFKEMQIAIKHISSCIAANTLMAEFWCLLGDIYYQSNDFDRAKLFYENAIILGKHRVLSDLYSMDINKYKKYPNKMIENCNQFIKSDHYILENNI